MQGGSHGPSQRNPGHLPAGLVRVPGPAPGRLAAEGRQGRAHHAHRAGGGRPLPGARHARGLVHGAAAHAAPGPRSADRGRRVQA